MVGKMVWLLEQLIFPQKKQKVLGLKIFFNMWNAFSTDLHA